MVLEVGSKQQILRRERATCFGKWIQSIVTITKPRVRKMAAGFTPPVINWSATDITDEFQTFKQCCTLIFTGPFSKRTDAEKASFILLWIGQQGVDIYNSFTWESDDDKRKPNVIWEKFERHLAPKSNHRLARFQLQQLRRSKWKYRWFHDQMPQPSD